MLGEVETCLLPTGTALRRDETIDLLGQLMPDSTIFWRERPISLAISPPTVEGVDCQLKVPTRPSVRAIGTVATRSLVFGGRVLQSSSMTRVEAGANGQRQTWSHYLSRAGVLETVTKIAKDTGTGLAEGFLVPGSASDSTLDLTSIANRLLGRIRMDGRLDQRVPLPSEATRLRWSARVDRKNPPSVRFRLQDDRVRAVLVTVGSAPELDDVQRFCEDLAVHDWLLTATSAAIDQSDLFPPGSTESVAVLVPVLRHLAHVWMPRAHTPPGLRALWDELEEAPGLTAGRRGLVDQVRDRVLVAALDALRHSRTMPQD
ncbi:SCO2521 family protein [Nocardia sp. NPDC050713]|uniref:SCO2521 family protein n=1 Tax=unclassified Nocardia TaxID=2637762 RepID=UPI0033AF5473